MKILIYTDVHWSATSSIVRGRGEKYFERLENCIKSVNFAESEATRLKCDSIVCMGDFFDRNNLTDEEITAMNDIKWAHLSHFFLVGNHDSGEGDLRFSTTQCLTKERFAVFSHPDFLTVGNTDLLFLPYMGDSQRKTIKEWATSLKLRQKGHKLVVFSHNDLKGVQYGKYISEHGFDLNDIEDSCDLFLNGHLHNGSYVDASGKILNLGNLTGLNFSEDASVYQHLFAILDTDSLSISFYENPYAYNFYKMAIGTESDLSHIDLLKTGAVLSVSCPESLVEGLRKKLDADTNITEYRIISRPEATVAGTDGTKLKSLNSIDYLGEFDSFVREKMGDTESVREELKEISAEGGTR